MFRSGKASNDSTGKPTSPAPAGSPAAVQATVDRAALLSDVISIYASAMEYPEEVFTEAVELEAELGIDSVKQTELLARVSQKYGLPAPPSDFRLFELRHDG